MLSLIEAAPARFLNPCKPISLDDGFSKFNRIYLFTFCIIAGIVVSVNDLAGETIECHGFQIFELRFYENYCWTQGLYTIKEAYDLGSDQLPYPGLIPEDYSCISYTLTNGTTVKCPDDVVPLSRVYHLWYQWIPFYFWICAAVCYVPYVVFHSSEVGRIKPILKLLQSNIESNDEERLDKGSNWLASRLHSLIAVRGPFQWLLVRHKYFFVLVFLKTANLLGAVFIIYFTNNMFELSSYSSYGYDWLVYVTGSADSTADNPIDKLFPKMTACEVRKWGPTGIVNEAGMCVLAPNVVNSYFFLIFWFVLMLAVLVNSFAFVFSTTTYLFTLGRWKNLMAKTLRTGSANEKRMFFGSGLTGQITLDIIARNTSPDVLSRLLKKTTDKMVAKEQRERQIYVVSNKMANTKA